MGALALLALLSGATMMTMMTMMQSSDTGDDTDNDTGAPDPAETEDAPQVPDDPGDVGATFAVDDEGVTIDVGDDETRSLATFIYVDTQDSSNPDDFLKTYEARFYFVPEDVDLPDRTWDTRADVPGATEYGGSRFDYALEDFEAHFGLDLLGTVPLPKPDPSVTQPTLGFSVSPLPIQGDMAAPLPEINVNRPFDLYYLEANTDGDELVTFLPEDFVETRCGATLQSATENTSGTDQVDWISADADGITVDGLGGDDYLQTTNSDVILNGGLGDDEIVAQGGPVIVNGGEGDDDVRINTGTVRGGGGDDFVSILSVSIEGGAGNDYIANDGDGASTLDGGAGDDRVILRGTGSEGYGGEGADFVSTAAGASGFGGDGDDTLQLDAGSFADGGAGNDLFRIWDFTTTMTARRRSQRARVPIQSRYGHAMLLAARPRACI